MDDAFTGGAWRLAEDVMRLFALVNGWRIDRLSQTYAAVFSGADLSAALP